MAENVLGRGTIELVADARKLKAGIEEAKKSIRTLGEGQKDISKAASESIDRYIGKLQQQSATIGKTARETELYKLALRGASNEQINAANAALKFGEIQERNAAIISGLRGAIVTVGIAAATAFSFKTAGTIELLDRLNDLHKATGVTVEDLAGLSLLAKQTGTDLDGIAKGINKMSVEMGKDPGKFKELGVTASDSVEAFKQLADIFNTIPDIALRNALAQKVFNKSWQELAPALSEGSKGIGEAIEKGKRMSGITAEMARQADEFNDKLAELKIRGAAVGSALIPALTKIVDLLARGKDAASGFISALGKAFSGPTDLDRLADVEARLATVQNNPRGFRSSNQIKALEAERDRLRDLVAQNARPLEEDPSMQGALGQGITAAQRKAQQDAASKARRFLDEGAADRSEQEAKARLALDLEEIKKRSDAQVNALKNSESIMQALRSADLVEDKDYFASKLAFIRLNSQEQEKALQEQIDRLQKEKFAGKNAAKDRLDNDKKILETQAQLTKARAESATQIQINAIQEEAANRKIVQSIEDARVAADAYIGTIQRRNQLEIEGIGRGNRARELNAGLSDIDERLSARRRELEGELRRGQITRDVFETYLSIAEQAYKKEVDLYVKRTAAITNAEQDWINGAREALNNYYDESRNVAKLTEQAFSRSFSSIEDSLVELANTGKLNFKSLINSILSDLNRIAIKQSITGPLAKVLLGQLGESGSGSSGVKQESQTSGSGGGILGGIFGKILSLIPSFDTGINYVPRDMLAMIHKGERIVPAVENTTENIAPIINQTFVISGNVDRRSQAQIAAASGQGVRDAMARYT